MKFSNLVELRLRYLIATWLLVFCSSVVAQPKAWATGNRCEAAFTSGSSTTSELFTKLRENTLELRKQLYLYGEGEVGVHATQQTLRYSAKLALQLFKLNGAEVRLISYEGFVAVEVLPNPSSKNGWNRMATSLRQNYGHRLIYAPHSLAIHVTDAKWDRETKAILISHESLRVGRSERNVLHEVGHMKSDFTKKDSPNVFSGFIEAAVPTSLNPLTIISDEALHYRDGQDQDELPRYAQDLDRLGRDLLADDSAEIRNQLRSVATRGRELLANAKTSISHARKTSEALLEKTISSGPLLLEDGTIGVSRAYVQAGKATQVSVERFENGTLRLRLEDEELTSEIWVKEEIDWSKLIVNLQHNETRAKREFSKRFTNLVLHWENDLKPSLHALRESGEAIISKGTSMPATELSLVAKAPRAIVAPHLRRNSR